MTKESSYYSNIRAEVAAFLPKRYHRVLEIGCGAGNFYGNVNQHCEYWGIEPFQPAAKIAAKTYDRVLMGPYEEVLEELPGDYFDLVICNDVIEHMTDHNMFFQTIKHKMAKDSYIVGSVPNVRYFYNLLELLVRKDWLYRDDGILDRTHMRFFTERSLKRTFAENNFVIEELHGINRMPIKSTSIKDVIKLFLIYFIGTDSQFLQFGFRIRNTVP